MYDIFVKEFTRLKEKNETRIIKDLQIEIAYEVGLYKNKDDEIGIDYYVQASFSDFITNNIDGSLVSGVHSLQNTQRFILSFLCKENTMKTSCPGCAAVLDKEVKKCSYCKAKVDNGGYWRLDLKGDDCTFYIE